MNHYLLLSSVRPAHPDTTVPSFNVTWRSVADPCLARCILARGIWKYTRGGQSRVVRFFESTLQIAIFAKVCCLFVHLPSFWTHPPYNPYPSRVAQFPCPLPPYQTCKTDLRRSSLTSAYLCTWRSVADPGSTDPCLARCILARGIWLHTRGGQSRVVSFF